MSFNSEYLVDGYGVEEGLPGNACTGIGQTPDGYLWFSSLSGVARFNGIEFTIFTAENQPALPDTRVVNSFTDRRGRLFLGTLGGLAMKDGNSWTNFSESRNWGERELVRSYAEGAAKELFLTTSLGRVFRVEKNHLRELPGAPGKGGAYGGVDVNGQPWIVRGDFVGFWNGAQWQDFTNIPNVVASAVGLGQARDGGVWLVLTNRALLLRNRETVREIPLTNTVEGFWQLLEDSQGNLWLPCLNRGVNRIAPDGNIQLYRRGSGLPTDAGTRAVFEDTQGSLWIGCGAGGVVRFRPDKFHALTRAAGLPDVAATSITSLPDGKILIGTYGAGLAVFDGRRVQPGVALPSKFVTSLVRVRGGDILAGTAGDGLFQISGQQVKSLNQEIPGLPASVTALFYDSTDRLWVGSSASVGYLKKGVFQWLHTKDALHMESVYFAEGKTRRILVANQTHLFEVDLPTDGLKLLLTLPGSCRITSLLVDAQDRVWIGTDKSGLFVFNQSRLLKLPDSLGLPDKNINALIEDGQQQIWFGCGRSVVSAKLEDLWAVASSTNQKAGLRLFNNRDGLGTTEFLEGFQPASYRDLNGRLWFPLQRRVAAVNPARLVFPTNAAPLVLEALDYFPAGSNQPVHLDLTGARVAPRVLPAGSRQIQLSCALLDFGDADKKNYRFQFDRRGDEWRDNGSAGELSFYELPPGQHVLSVQAVNGNGIASAVKTLEFVVEDYFWRTTRFWILCSSLLVLITGGATWWVMRRRVRQARKILARERELAALQARLALVLENTSDFVGFADAAGKMFHLNSAGRKLIGLDPAASLEGLTMASLYPKWVTQAHAELWRSGPTAQNVWTGESALRHRNGREIPISQVVIAHRHADGSLDFSSTISRDISAAKRDERIREALRDLSAALTAALVPVELGRTVAQECQKIFQHDAFFFIIVEPGEKVMPGGYWENTAPGTLRMESQPAGGEITLVGPALREVIAGKNLLINRAAHERPPADELDRFGNTARPSASLMFAPVSWEGRTVGAISVQSYTPNRYTEEDLTLLRSCADQCGPVIARLLVEDRLRQNEERLRLAMDAARIGSWEIILDGARLIASGQAEKIYGFAPGTMGSDVRQFMEKIPIAEVDAVRAQFTELLAARVETIGCIHRWQLPDGAEKWLEVKGHLHRDAETGKVRALGITADISERHRAELEKIRLETQLRQAQKMDALGRLAGGIAHDFNNILTGIIGYNQLAMMDLPPDHSAASSLREIGLGADRAKQLVAQILTFSSQREQSRANLPLWPVVAEALKLLRSSLPANIEIRSHPLTTGDDFISGDPTQIHQVIMNLGTNSAYAMRPHGGVLEVREEALSFSAPWSDGQRPMPAGNYLRLTVADNGVGMTPEILERIFEPFYSTKPPTEGTGLGLAVVHGILRNHDAAIHVSSELGKGTVFQITFPAVRPATPPPATTAAAPRGNGQHILMVDDEEHITRLAVRYLTRQGYRITSFNGPQAALAAFEAKPKHFDLLLTDLTMPVMSGLELAGKIHARRPELPIILSSGFAGQSDRAGWDAVGIRHLLEKPYNVEGLAEIIARALQQS